MSEVNLHYQLEPETPCACQCCDWEGRADQLEMIVDIEQRIYPGETVPAGQCPECRACAYTSASIQPDPWRALALDMWDFIENVTDEDSERHDKFFALRARLRETQS